MLLLKLFNLLNSDLACVRFSLILNHDKAVERELAVFVVLFGLPGRHIK